MCTTFGVIYTGGYLEDCFRFSQNVHCTEISVQTDLWVQETFPACQMRPYTKFHKCLLTRLSV